MTENTAANRKPATRTEFRKGNLLENGRTAEILNLIPMGREEQLFPAHVQKWTGYGRIFLRMNANPAAAPAATLRRLCLLRASHFSSSFWTRQTPPPRPLP